MHKLALVGMASICVWQLTAAAESLSWPQWRGPERTDLSQETGLLKSWPEGGPRRVWLYDQAGQGYSGPAIVDGRFFTMGTRDGQEVLLVLDPNTGKEQWTAVIGDLYKNGWGDGPRGTPTVDGDRVYAMGGTGALICAQAADGKILWQTSMTKLAGAAPEWGYAESPLVDGKQLICTPGGNKGALATLDKMTGKVLWRSEGFTDGAQYSSVIIANHNGTHQYIQLTMKSVVGVAAPDGKVLWRSNWPGRTAVIPTPIYKDGYVYVTSGYNAGCKLLQIGADNQVQTVYENKVMKNHHGGVILLGDYLYGYSDGPGWVCQDFKSGREVWSSKDFGKGAVGYADGMFYCLEESSGTVVLAEASPVAWKQKGRFKLDPQTKIRSPQGRIWTHPVICNGKLYLRDQDLIYCYDVKR
jgi:outer membrane protein assembly factor BamB